MSDETRKIDLGAYSLRARMLGQGEQTYVLLHGFADGMDVWDGVAPALASNARVALIELRGHGYSGGPAGPYAWDDLGKELVTVLDRLEIQKATLVGHGLGGIIALLTALQAPDRVERLVLIGTATQANAEQENWCREIMKAGKWNALQGIAHAIFGPTSRKQVDGTAGPLIELAKRMETLRAQPITERMSAVACPTLVLVGSKDPAETGPLVDALPSGRLEILDGLGHFPHKNEPAKVVAAIQQFAR